MLRLMSYLNYACSFREKPGDLNTIAVKLLDEVIGRTSYSGIVYDLDVSWEKIFQAYSVRVDNGVKKVSVE